MKQVTALTLLKNSSDVRALLNDDIILKIRKKIINRYGSLRKFSKEFGLSKDALVNWLSNGYRRTNIPIRDLFKLAKILRIDRNLLVKSIKGFSSWGCHSVVKLKKKAFNIDNKMVVGLGLYVGDGYTSKKQSKIIFTNTNKALIEFFIRWLSKYFGVEKSELYYLIYKNDEDSNYCINYFGLKNCRVKIYNHSNINQKISCKVHLSTAIYRRILDSLIEYSKLIIPKNTEFRSAYLQGIFAAEGCVHLSNIGVPQIFIEMKEGKEIDYIENLFTLSDIRFRKYYRPRSRIKLCVYKQSEIRKLNVMNIAKLHDDKSKKFENIIQLKHLQ